MGILSKHKKAYTEEDYNALRVYQAIRDQGPEVLYQVLLWGLPPFVDVTNFGQYVKDCATTNKHIKLSKTDLANIAADPTGENYDVTLLYKCIKLCCTKVAGCKEDKWVNDTISPPPLEYLVTQIKNKRNDICHGTEGIDTPTMDKMLADIKNILKSTIVAAGILYGKESDANGKVANITHNVDLIINALLGSDDIERNRIEMLILSLKSGGSKEMCEQIGKLVCLNPLSFLGDYFMDIDLIFSKPNIEKVIDSSTREKIDLNNILDINCIIKSVPVTPADSGATPIIILEGIAGSGKTVLFKFLLNEWKNKSNFISGLDSFDLVIPMMCRDSHADSFGKLLALLLQDTFKNFRSDDELLRCVLALRILVLVDGLDEMTNDSCKIFYELLSHQKSKDITILCTSRPVNVKSLKLKIPEEIQVAHLSIKGIPANDRAEFVEKYHKTTMTKSKDEEATRALVQYMNRASSKLQHHFSLPRNLVLVTYLWSIKPQKVEKITTATELYLEVDKLTSEMLEKKLVDGDANFVSDESGNLSQSCERFQKAMFAEALICISRNQVYIPTDSKERLEATCKGLGLSASKVLSHYFVSKQITTGKGEDQKMEFSHKDIQDYYAARCLYYALIKEDYFEYFQKYIPNNSGIFKSVKMLIYGYSDITLPSPGLDMDMHFIPERKVWSVLQCLHHDKKKDMEFKAYCNVFKHLAGLLGLSRDTISEDTAKDLVWNLSTAGLTNRDDWLGVLREAKCDASTSKLIANCVSQSLEGSIYITEDDVGVYASLMPYAKPQEVTIELTTGSEQLPRLKELLQIIEKHSSDIEVNLKFLHDVGHLKSSDYLLKVFTHDSRCSLQTFIGHVSDLHCLPKTLETLCISVGDDDQARNFEELVSSLPTLLPKLTKLGVHIKENVTIGTVPAMPVLSFAPDLYLWNIKKATVGWAAKMIAGIQNEQGFDNIFFINCNLMEEDSLQLVQLLKDEDVKIKKSLYLSSADLPENTDNLHSHVKTELGCALALLKDEEDWHMHL